MENSMNKPQWRIEHTMMKHGAISTDWQGSTPEEAIVAFLAWCDIRGEFVEVFDIKRTKNLQEQLDVEFANDNASTIGD